MAEGLKIKIGADIVEVTQSLNDVERDIKQLSKEIKNLSGQALVDANKQLEVLNQRAQGLKNIGRSGFDQFGAAIQGAGRSAAGAVPALNSLGQVARDLPFGFIAIQNNLPIVIDQFTALSRSSGGLGPALKGLAGALVGPAGIAFAFGAVISGVTALIQKYGSLGAAITEFTSAQDAASKASRALGKEVADALSQQNGEIQSLNNYVAILTDVNKSQNERTNAYKFLKKEFPGVLENISKENALTAAGASIINARSQQLIEYIKLKAKESALIKLGEDAFKRQILAQEQGKNILNSNNTALGNFLNTLAGGFAPGAGNLIGLNRRLQSVGDDLDAATQEADAFALQLREVQNQIASFDPKLIDPEKGLAKGKKAATDAYKQIRAELEAYQNALKAEQGTVPKISTSYRDLAIAIAETEARIKSLGVTNPQVLAQIQNELSATIEGIRRNFANSKLEVDLTPVFSLKKDNLLNTLSKDNLSFEGVFAAGITPNLDPANLALREYNAALEETKKASQSAGPVIASLFSSFIATNQNFTKGAVDNFNLVKDQVANVTKQFNDFLAPAIDTVFGALQNGTSIPKALGQAFKALIAQLAITVVKAAALAAILSLIPGLGPLLGVAGGAGGAGGFGKLFGSLLGFSGKQTAAPTFGNLQPGGLQLAGGVALTLRGTDLVGAISGANARINRVG